MLQWSPSYAAMGNDKSGHIRGVGAGEGELRNYLLEYGLVKPLKFK